MDKRYVFDFYVKDAPSDLQKAIFHILTDAETVYYDKWYLAWKKDNFATLRRMEDGIWDDMTDEELFAILCEVREPCKEMNEAMIKWGYAPLFPSLDDIDDVMTRKMNLARFLPTDECCKIVGCESYESFVPPRYTEE